MPNAKRPRGSGSAKNRKTQDSGLETDDCHPIPVELEEEEHQFVQLAKKHWLKPSKRTAKPRIKNEIIKQGIWDVLEKEHFPYRSLLLLENLQALESYLWPAYTDESSNYHVLLMALIINVKRREHLETWNNFEDKPDAFSSMFRRILSLILDRTLSADVRKNLVCFLIHAFQSLDCAMVRKECAPLVSIGIWQNMSVEKQWEAHLDKAPHLRKAWRASIKRYDAADETTKARIRFERSWLYSLLLDFMDIMCNMGSEAALYCELFVEFLSDLQSQLPTRRYVNALLQDLNLLPVVKLSSMYNDESNILLRELCDLLSHYTHFNINDQSGIQLSLAENYDMHCESLGKLQRVALKYFRDKLTVLALSNYGAIDTRNELESLLELLTDDELLRLVNLLGIRSTYPENLKLRIDRKLLVEILVGRFERRKTFQDLAQSTMLMPTEQTLFDSHFRRADEYDGSRPLALPKLNLQYLSAGDFLWRAFVLFRYESFYGIRRDIEAALRRLRPEIRQSGVTHFSGFSRMAIPISKPTVLEVMPPCVGEDQPSMVKAEISIDIQRLGANARREWDSLRPEDVVFLLAIEPPGADHIAGSGDARSEYQKFGVLCVRAAEVLQITDDKGQHIRDGAARLDTKRRIYLKLDPFSFVKDSELAAAGKPDIYGRINLLLRRNRRENNFKPILESIRSLVLLEAPLPAWLHEVFLGYGDPASASYKNLGNRIKKLDFRDTFLSWEHMIESLPGKTLEPDDNVSGSFGPPYVLEEVDKADTCSAAKPSKKRRRDAETDLKSEIETLMVSTYTPSNNGPYPADKPRRNAVRFTPAQVEAITSGMQPGITIIVGPPGTGKTDVATQIISNIYHNFPDQKTLLVTHSNQALNQLFAKIVALDIDDRHLLRLGHGEEDLDTEGSFSNYGRVESFMRNRQRLLQEVKKLAASMGAPGAHDNSAETAGYFNKVYVEPAWTRFLRSSASDEVNTSQMVQEFPFHEFFADAPQPLFPQSADRAQVIEIAQGCQQHISKIFSELADILPFEILRRERERAQYLLTNEARIIAMTTTHAAIRRGEISSLNFRYDNVIMEEAAQITEMETFMAFTLQKPISGQMPLQRIVLCGDHFQNSPVIQNLAFRHYANLEQSLFSRLVRLGVPTITLDQQGRARPSIAKLYKWRYPKLGNLPDVMNRAEFAKGNAGFKFDYQFINVPSYMGRGEAEPTPHFIQNLGEAEYAVALYQYMRLLGYPANKISILTTYAGQKALVKDVLSHRCARNPMFAMPKAVATVDKYQGEQNDYIILSLTRTSRAGYLRDVRRMTVAMSRARLGLYVLGRRGVFEACSELRPAFDILLARPDKLMLVTGELWPTERPNGTDDVAVEGEVVMEGVEHLGQYVCNMTKTRIKQLQWEEENPAVIPELSATAGEAEDEGQGRYYDDDESPEAMDQD